MEEQATAAYQVRVYRYAVYGDLPEKAMDELRRAHELREELVQIEARYAERVDEVWQRHPEIKDLEDRITAAQARVEEQAEIAKNIRKQERTTDIGRKQREQFKEAKAVLRDLKRERREAKSRLYTQHAQLKAGLVEANQKRREEIKATYRTAIDDGLYWATYNDVKAAHETAVKAVSAKRAAGQPAQLHPHAWLGEGTLAVQLQRGAGQPPRSAEALADRNGRWRNVMTIEPAHDVVEWATMTRSQRRFAARGRLRFRIGSGETSEMIEVPLIVHRPIPPEGDIVLARITRRPFEDRARVAVSVAVRLPTPPRRVEGGVGAVHVGWRALPDGYLRVAVVVGAPPTLSVDDIEDVVRLNHGFAEIVIPPRMRDVSARCESIRSIRDRSTDALRSQLLEWAEAHPDYEHTQGLAQWRSPKRFLRLERVWSTEPPDDLEPVYIEMLHAWGRQDWHLWTWAVNELDQIRARRKDKYRKIANWLLKDLAVVAIDSWDISTRRPNVDDVDDHQARAARANRVLAAPAELRTVVEHGATARGVQVVAGSPKASIHRACGTEFDREERRDQIMVWCPTCQLAVDQDVNAALSLAESALK